MEIAVYRDFAAKRLLIGRIEATDDGSDASFAYDSEYLRSQISAHV